MLWNCSATKITNLEVCEATNDPFWHNIHKGNQGSSCETPLWNKNSAANSHKEKILEMFQKTENTLSGFLLQKYVTNTFANKKTKYLNRHVFAQSIEDDNGFLTDSIQVPNVQGQLQVISPWHEEPWNL